VPFGWIAGDEVYGRSSKLRAACEDAGVIRYADDMVALCHSQEQAREVKARLAEWLAPRGLVFNEEKTKINANNYEKRNEHIVKMAAKLCDHAGRPRRRHLDPMPRSVS
jgi:hypothetical protein